VDVRHLPSICASIDKTKTETKVHCIYRLACLCKEFKEVLCADAPLHEALQTLGASKFSQVNWMVKWSNTFHLWRYVLGTRIVNGTSLTNVEGWQHDIQGFLGSDGQVPYCKFIANARSSLSTNDFESKVQDVRSRDVCEILAEVDEMAAQQFAGNLAPAAFLGSIPGISLRLRNLARQFLINHYTVVNTMDLMTDYYVQHIATDVSDLSQVQRDRLDIVSEIMAVTASMGAGAGIEKKKTELHQSFIVNGWYLCVIVTQHHGQGEEEPDLLPQYRATELKAEDSLEVGRIVYLVKTNIPIIQVRICNLERKAIEHDVECDRQLVIKNSKDSNEESLTRERTEVTLTFRTEDMLKMLKINCDILEEYPWLPEEVKTAVLSIVLRPT